MGRKHLFTIFIIFLTSHTALLAQSNLMKQVTIDIKNRERISYLLEKIASKQSFSFAYNNQVVPADSLVSVSGYRGTLLGLLEHILGNNYEFKEVPGYIVLRYAPRKLFIIAEATNDEGTHTVLKGYVRDVSDQRPVPKASVYEKDLLLSTLTNDKGYFEMKTKSSTGSMILTASKENYRDTTLNMLPDVVVQERRSGKRYRYYPDDATDGRVEHSRFARFFLSSKQLLQGLNVGNFFASSPYQVSLVPRLSTHGLYNSQVVDHVSINLIGGYTAGINGAEFGGLFNINRKDVRLFQAASTFNFVGGSSTGVQLAGLYNRVLGKATGFQFAGLANNTNRFKGGFQLGLLANKTEQFSGGFQLAALANINKQANSLHLTALMNTAVSSKGITIAGLTNVTRDSSTIQVAGLMNKSRSVSLLQLGFMNITKMAKGLQIGFINVADSSDHALGIVNLIKNGEKSISLSTDESFFTHADLRTGGKILYGMIGLGFQQDDNKSQYALDLGVGAHIIIQDKFSLNTEYVTTFYRRKSNSSCQSYSVNVLPAYNFNKHWAFFAGPAFRLTSVEQNQSINGHGWILHRSVTADHANTLSLGVTGGISYKWF